MSVIILVNQSNASQRVVPLPPLVWSNGTSACTNESGRTFGFSIGGVDYGSGGSISAISTVMGLYVCLFATSKASAIGQGFVYYGGTSSSSTALPSATPIEVVKYDSYDSMRFGQFALPNAAPGAAGGELTFGTGAGQLNPSSGSVGLIATTHSQATIGGINNILPAVYSGVSLEVKTGGIQTTSVGVGTYSSVTFQGLTNYANISSVTLNAGTHSGATIQGLSNYANISNVTLAAGTHSNVTIQGISNYANISVVTLAPGTHSNVTIQAVTQVGSSVTVHDADYSAVTMRIKPMAYSGLTIDGAMFLSPAGERSAASSLLSTNMGGTTARLFQQGWELLRNKVIVSGSTMKVMKGDDVTSSWTATISTGTATVYGVAPGIA
jgi:hypothetical protein